MVLGGCGWFQVVSHGFGQFTVLVVTVHTYLFCYFKTLIYSKLRQTTKTALVHSHQAPHNALGQSSHSIYLTQLSILPWELPKTVTNLDIETTIIPNTASFQSLNNNTSRNPKTLQTETTVHIHPMKLTKKLLSKVRTFLKTNIYYYHK